MGRRQDGDDSATNDQDPNEIVGPEECNSGAEDAEFRPGELDATPEAGQPNFSEELMEPYAPEMEMMVPDQFDGLPIPADERPADQAAQAPPFTYDTVVCVEDAREFVEIFLDDEDSSTMTPSRGDTLRKRVSGYKVFDGMGPALKTLPQIGDLRSKFLTDGNKRERRRFQPDQVIELWGIHCAKDETDRLVFVRPVRERCIHYKRQVFSNDAIPDPTQPGHQIVFRNCMIRRSIGGAFLSLRDEAMYACDYRVPGEPDSVHRHLDLKDSNRLAGNAHKIRLPLFNLG